MSDQKIVPIHYSLPIKVFEHDGFSIRRRKGDHVIMTKPGVNRPLVIKTSPKSVPVTHIRTNMLNHLNAHNSALTTRTNRTNATIAFFRSKSSQRC